MNKIPKEKAERVRVAVPNNTSVNFHSTDHVYCMGF
jgi:hypothetical protein